MPKDIAALNGVHPKPLRVELRPEAKDVSKKLAMGQSVERALAIAGWTKQGAAYDMGYSDAGTVSRWCAGTERPHFDKLFDLGGFETAWVKVRALGNPQMAIETVIRITEVA